MLDLDFDDTAGRGLRRYVRLVGKALGLRGECSYVQVEPPAHAYLALDGHHPRFPGHDVALVWDETAGWSVAVESGGGEDLIMVAHYGADVLPAPRVVAIWAADVLAHGLTSPGEEQADAQDVWTRLSVYAHPKLVTAVTQSSEVESSIPS